MQAVEQVITIDGPSGSGKGTIGHQLAEKLGWHFLDSGALYRLLALSVIQHKTNLVDDKAIAQLGSAMQVEFKSNHEIFLNGVEVSRAIRSEDCSLVASKIAGFQIVRDALFALQRSFLRAPGLVADGRDMGTVIFPKAMTKIFLTASAEERAQRRFSQLQEKGLSVSLEQLLTEIKARDERDIHRSVAPLKPAPDALVIDTTQLTISQVLALIAAHLPIRLIE